MHSFTIALDESDASCTATLQAVEALRARGNEVTFLALRSGRRVLCTRDPATESYADLGFSGRACFHLPERAIRKAQGALSPSYLGIFDSLRLYDACRRNLTGIDVLHERHDIHGFGIACASQRLGIPYVLFVDADPLAELDYLGRPLVGLQKVAATAMARYKFRVARRIVCVSEVAKCRLARRWDLPLEKIDVVPNGIDVERFRASRADALAARRELGFGDEPVVIFTGGFFPWHGLLDLIDAFAMAREEASAARLLLVGDGEIRGSVEERARSLGLDGTIVFTGRVPRRRIPALLAAADIAVAPYPRLPEGGIWFSPLKLFEYMAAGRAVVASRSGQMEEFLDDGHTALLVPPGDVREMSDALLRLLGDPTLRDRLGANAHRQATLQHSVQRQAERLQRVYERAM